MTLLETRSRRPDWHPWKEAMDREMATLNKAITRSAGRGASSSMLMWVRKPKDSEQLTIYLSSLRTGVF
jgi:hypothetical protein